jgi:hypothetical protein
MNELTIGRVVMNEIKHCHFTHPIKSALTTLSTVAKGLGKREKIADYIIMVDLWFSFKA